MRPLWNPLHLVLVLQVLFVVSPRAAGAPCDARLLLADTNADGEVDVSDPVFFLAWLFMGGPDPACFDGEASRKDCAAARSYYAGDCNDDRTIDISDPICILGWLFGGGPAPACVIPPGEAVCGDGVLAGGESCDDGNVNNGDGCNPTCSLTNQTASFAVGFENMGGLAIHDDVLWVADSGRNAILRIVDRIQVAFPAVFTIVAGDAEVGMPGHRDDVGLEALFRTPLALATDGQTLWISDTGNNVLRAMSTSPPYAVTTVAGTPGVSSPFVDGAGSGAVLPNPRGIVFHDGFVYLLDGQAAVLRRFDPASSEVVTLAGMPNVTGLVDGFGANARFTSPRYLTSDGIGKLYISDTNGAAIRVFEIASTFVGTFVGNGEPAYVDGVGDEVRVLRPRGIAVDGRSVYWACPERHSIRQGVFEERSISTLAGCGGSSGVCNPAHVEGVGIQARFDTPWDVAYHPTSNSLFVLDGGNAVIRRIR